MSKLDDDEGEDNGDTSTAAVNSLVEVSDEGRVVVSGFWMFGMLASREV